MDDTHPRAASAAPSSSSSDFYADNVTVPEQRLSASASEPVFPDGAPSDAHAAPASPGDENRDEPVADEDDSSSEMDFSEPSRSASPIPPPAAATATALVAATATATAASTSTTTMLTEHSATKRKLSETLDADSAIPQPDDSAKKPKLSVLAKQNGVDARNGRLPAELWQRIFLFLSPAVLCRCLRVCKAFNMYLTARATSIGPKSSRSRTRVLDGENIWTQSRKAYFPALPRPLLGFSELKMLQLIAARACQFCGKLPVPAASPASVFNAGPGPTGVRVIWPFGVRSCGPCLEQRILKDIEVLGDAMYRALRLGTPHGFRSQDLHFVSESVRQMPGGIPAHLRFSKVFYKPDLEAVKADEDNARALGPGAVDEWHKGLQTRGREAMADSARWEKWELQMRPGTDLAQVLREYDLSSFPRHIAEAQGRSAGVDGVQPSFTVNGAHPLPQPVHVFPTSYGNSFLPQQQLHSQHQIAQPVQFSSPQQMPRVARSPQEVEEARQARRAEIERRCKELEPPLSANVLQHMDAFQAALQITTPLTEAAWDLLKPRILAQREAAELVEHERSAQLAALQAAMPSALPDDLSTKGGKEPGDREYEQAQEPLRKKLGEYADDYINGQWSGGKMLERDNAPIFAIHVLLHVRRRYNEDKQLGFLPSFDPPRRKDHRDTPPLEPFLSLDNMKWVYDNKVRPLTDKHRREHFICAGCTEEKKPKWFAFEGLIQHYGAKHTSAFSKGNIIVHWQTAEWPEEPPFHTNPSHWLKLDRKAVESKHHGKVRRTPQGNQSGPYPAPPASAHLPENPYQAAGNNYAPVSQGYPPPQFASSPHTASNGYFLQHPAPRPVVDFESQINKLSNDAREIWDALDGIQDLLESIRMQAVIHHAANRFAGRFMQKPPLDLLTDALATSALTRPLKNAHGLACKSCVAAQTNGAAQHGSYWIRIKDVKLYNISALITHFKLMHQSQTLPGHLDWTKDMIEPPESHLLKELLRSPGMDDDKLALIAEAFPLAFPAPLPKIGIILKEASTSTVDALPTSRLLDRLSKRQPKNTSKKKGAKTNGTTERDLSQEPMPEPNEDEYDPRRPMFVAPKESAADPAQFDTDARRPAPPAEPVSGSGLQLNPETLAALQNLTALNMHPDAAAMEGAQDRSPSVGRVEPVSSSYHPAKVPTPAPTGQPDIAAILASLTGQDPAQTATPPHSIENRSGSASRQAYTDVYARSHHEATPAHQSDTRRASARQEASHQVLHDPGIAQLQSALSQNGRRFEQNHHPAYVDASYAPPVAPQSRQQYVVENEQYYNQQHAPAPMYREQPVQYIQMPPEREFPPQGYQYERVPPQPKPIYVDQYGRPLELIPIDSAPAPAQYAPIPYDHHQYGRPVEQSVYPVAQQPYEDRRPVYYEQVSPSGSRYAYDHIARGSLPR